MGRFFQLLIITFLIYQLIKYLRNLYTAAFGKKQSTSNSQKREEGKVTIDFIPSPKQTKANKEEAELVDFEEIK